ncbi:heterokaryon incompatibility domain-containing protein [Trichoderma pleuroticola]
MDLCRDCHGFAWAVSQRLQLWPGMDSFWNVDRLRAESRNCRLCKMIYDYILDSPQGLTSYMCSNLFFDSFEHPASGAPHTCVAFSGNTLWSRIEIAVWSDDGSPAALSGNFCTEPPLPSDNCPQAFDFIKSWIQTCSQEHDLCKGTLSKPFSNESAGPQLPTRVLDVGPLNHESVSLLATNRQRGEFCALSYCWGPEGTQTLVTTRDNIGDHLNGIQFNSLPKTFQDAVIVTRQLGIRYLWIDSLCIIQGDKDDWMKESAKMAGVYQNAFLVIAASGASNPKEGCFSNKRRCPTTVEVPYYLAEGQTAGSIKLSMRIHGLESPIWGPLSKRGWVLQEWYLARRLLHYMPKGMSWKCKMLESGERHLYSMELYDNSWEDILYSYSNRKLTHKEDRLAALEGLVQAQLEGTNEKYSFGIFESRIPEQLLWTIKSRAHSSEDLTNVPHWSWASKGGEKVFWTVYGDKWQPKSHTRAAFESFGVLKVDGFVAQSQTSIVRSRKPTHNRKRIFQNLLYMVGKFRKDSLHWIQIVSRQTRTIGVAVFDREHYARVHILFLNQWRNYRACFRLFFQQDFIGEDVMPYAVLLLIPSDKDGFFRRVGMGFVIPGPKSKKVPAVHQTIRLI